MFGPPGTRQPRTLPPGKASGELLSEVRVASLKLVDDLKRAEDLTGHWSDALLTEALVEAALSDCLLQLANTGCWGEANRLPSGELWQIAGRILEVGSLQHHARFKPHGYAGDYEMLARICEESCCEHPLGHAFDRYFLRQAAPHAVRARTQQTAAALAAHALRHQGKPYHVVSVGAGPALDVCQALSLLPETRRASLQVTLLDMDPNALDVARQRIGPLLARETAGLHQSGAPASRQLACVRTNLFRLAQPANAKSLPEAVDFLVCSGLFDYLAEEPAASLVELFWQRLSSGGLLLVGNFAPHNPSRAYMEWIGNWYLTYRTRGQMEQLAARAGIPPACLAIGCERTGIDLFLIARKP